MCTQTGANLVCACMNVSINRYVSVHVCVCVRALIYSAVYVSFLIYVHVFIFA